MILSGGGARAAYQVGALRAILEQNPAERFPFDVICGTSAGAINAAFLAAQAHQPQVAITALYDAWSTIRADDIYDTGWWPVFSNLGRIMLSPFSSSQRIAPNSLLDSAPLRRMLSQWIDFDAIKRNIHAGYLNSLSITAMDYSDGDSVSFFASSESTRWERRYRRGCEVELGVEHVMASAAIPILFPAVRIGERYFGDGALRQLHPMSPALKFGAKRLFVIGVSSPAAQSPEMIERRQPSIGQMAGHLLNREFIDNLDADIETANRFNSIANAIGAAQSEALNLQNIETCVLTPSMHFNEIAVRFMSRQPRSLRLLFNTLGLSKRGAGASFASYLMFDGGFCWELMQLGYKDAMQQKERVRAFLHGS